MTLDQFPTRVLLVEDWPQGGEGFEPALSELDGSGWRIERVGELSRALERLSLGGVDVVLLDLDLPDSRGLVTFERARAFAPDVPIVVLTARDDLETGVRTVQAGAQDYLVRGRLDEELLLRSIRYAIERHRLLSALRSLSLIDDLTGLYNRRGFMELGEQHLKVSRRSGRPVTLLSMDLDGFKEVNGAYGHHVGDRYLIGVADVLRDAFRASDLVARVGGDEFAILALETAGNDGAGLADRLRRRLEGEEGGRLSVSIGAAPYEEHGRRLRVDELLAEADGAMRREKRRKQGEIA